MEWPPHITVACIVEKDGKFLMVKEIKDGRTVYNQPAGHLEPNESLQQAALRETLEETAWQVELESALRVTLFTAPGNGVTYCRTTFVAKAVSHCSNQALDSDIEEALWLSYDDIIRLKDQLRSPVVLSDIEHYLAGHRIALEAFTQYPAPDAIST